MARARTVRSRMRGWGSEEGAMAAELSEAFPKMRTFSRVLRKERASA